MNACPNINQFRAFKNHTNNYNDDDDEKKFP